MLNADLIFLHAPSVYDFRERAVLYGPISDLVPSTPVFEMYPIGFVTLSDYLERHGFRTRIINLAVRMLRDRTFDAEKLIASLNPLAFAIDLHWMPHAHGALAVAGLVKRHHPETPVIFGGFSSSYYHQELIARTEVDFVVRGDSTEEPLHLLMAYLRGDDDAPHTLTAIPNLTYRDAMGETHVNPITDVPDSLDHLSLDYQHIVRTVVRDLDIADYLPFASWLDYPIMAGLSCRGCNYHCLTCGGSADAFEKVYGRQRPAFRSPEKLANDMRTIQRFSRGPVFVIGDLRQPGLDYAHRFLRTLAHTDEQVMIELFAPAPRSFLRAVANAVPNFVLEVSLETHDPRVRRAFNKTYSNAAIERTMDYALAVGCKRLDVFFMIGLPGQTVDSVMRTIDYAGTLLERFGADKRLHPFIAPLAPFLDPGSLAFEHSERYGYQLYARTLEEHRRALLGPSWKHVLNYRTRWMSRDDIVTATYEAGRRLNALKAAHQLVPADRAAQTDARIRRAVELIGVIDECVARGPAVLERELTALKPEIDAINESIVCEKSELEMRSEPYPFNPLMIAHAWVESAVENVAHALKT